jgi:hypothetical protein
MPRTLESRLKLFEEGFFEGYEDTRRNPKSAVNPVQKGDRSRGWTAGHQKALEDISAGARANPTPPEQTREKYTDWLREQGAPLAEHAPADLPRTATGQIDYDKVSFDMAPNEDLDEYDETKAPAEGALDFAIGEEPAGQTGSLLDEGLDPDMPDFLRN